MFKYDSKNKKHVSLSFAERLNDTKRLRFEVERKDLVVCSTEQVYDESLDRVVNLPKKVVVKARERMANYKVSDFYLENLAAIGALKQLKPSVLSSSTDDIIQSIEQTFKQE